jgi:hypothetical protein
MSPLHEIDGPQGCLHPLVQMVVDELGMMTMIEPDTDVSAPVLAYHHECAMCHATIALLTEPS